jgi:tetratricopeptide (TPR) repeat protein
MPVYRHDRLPGGSHHIRQSSWEDEAAGAIVGGAASAAGWLVGSGISGLRTLARNSHDRKLAIAAADLEAASESDDDSRFLSLARSFTYRYPQFADGHVAVAQALQRQGQFEAAIQSLDRAVQLGLDESAAHALRADIYDDSGSIGKAIQEYTFLAGSPAAKSDPELKATGLLCRARLLLKIGDAEQALSDVNDAIGVLPDETAYAMRGHVHRRMGEFDRCLADYGRSVQLCPDNPDFLENRADVYELLGRTADAESDRATAARLRQPVSAPSDSAKPARATDSLPSPSRPVASSRQSERDTALIVGACIVGFILLLLCVVGLML